MAGRDSHMTSKKVQRNHAKDKKHHVLLLAELTHKLTGEEESDIRGYLEKFGIEGFFARLNNSDSSSDIKTILNKMHKDLE
jgi:GH18 family chitinase